MPHNKRKQVDTKELRGLVEQAPDAYFLHDFEGQILDVNQRACSSLRYTREELLALNVFDVERGIDRSAAQLAWAAMTPGEGITLSGFQERKDGSVFPVEARISVCIVGEERLYLGLVRDVTERKIAEDALRATSERYNTLFNSIDEGFCLIEVLFNSVGQARDYRFLEVNPAFEKHVGLVGATGKTIRELVPNIERKWIEIYGQVAITGKSVRFRETSQSLEQSSFDVYAFRFGGHGSARVAVLFANVTERVAAERALKESERLALIGRLAGVISHEINNPLDAIQNLLYMAELEKDPAAARELIRAAQKEVTAATSIVTQTLKFTRHVEEPAPEKLSDIVDSALVLLQGKSKRAGIDVQRDVSPHKDVLCLSSELRQVFANLLTNAFDAAPKNGRVTVRIRNAPHWKTGEDGVRLIIADNGCGMSAETQKRLFQAFYTTKGAKGTGLGLWLSHEILTRHGVDLRVRSRQGDRWNGTTFSLWFRAHPERSARGARRTREVPSAMAHSMER